MYMYVTSALYVIFVFCTQYGSEVTDHSIFAKLTRHWEEEYHKDMDALNVSHM